jgi:hypothetical protein
VKAILEEIAVRDSPVNAPITGCRIPMRLYDGLSSFEELRQPLRDDRRWSLAEFEGPAHDGE